MVVLDHVGSLGNFDWTKFLHKRCGFSFHDLCRSAFICISAQANTSWEPKPLTNWSRSKALNIKLRIVNLHEPRPPQT